MTKSLYDIINFIIVLSNNDDQTLINITSVNITLLKTMISMTRSMMREFLLNKGAEVSLTFSSTIQMAVSWKYLNYRVTSVISPR